jgi:hypothetical protein
MSYDLKEFVRVANAFRNTPIVDNDFPEMRERYDLELARLERAINENGLGIAARVSADTLNEVGVELAKARQTHAPMNGHHEGYAVMLEEMDELWEVCKRNTHKQSIVNVEQARIDKRAAMRKEALQVAAMAVRFIEDVCDKS